VMDSPHTDPELHDWLRWAAEDGNTPAYVRPVAEAALIACLPDYELLRPVLVELMRQHPEPPPGPAASGDPATSDFKSVGGTHKRHGPYTAEAQRTLVLSAGQVPYSLKDFLINRGTGAKAIRNCSFGPFKKPSSLLLGSNVEANHPYEACEVWGQLGQAYGEVFKAGLMVLPIHASP